MTKTRKNTMDICPTDHAHDRTQVCYAKHGCRCDDCKARRRADVKRWNANTEPVKEPTVKHGTLAGYQTHRREGTPACDLCKAANTGYQHGAKVRRLAYAKTAALQIDRATRRDIDAALALALDQLDNRARTTGVNAPLFRARADRLREARELIIQATIQPIN